MLDPQPLAKRWRTPKPLDSVVAAIEGAALLRDEPFALTWKLSGGGIVGRVMDVPATDRAFVGRATPFGYELVATPSATHRHAFEAIAEVALAEDATGTSVGLTLRLHKEQRSLAVPFGLMGIGCLVSAALAATSQPGMAGLSAALGAAFLALPPLRTRGLFGASARATEAALTELLGLVKA